MLRNTTEATVLNKATYSSCMYWLIANQKFYCYYVIVFSNLEVHFVTKSVSIPLSYGGETNS